MAVSPETPLIPVSPRLRERRQLRRRRRRRRRQIAAVTILVALAAAIGLHVERGSSGGTREPDGPIGPFALPTPSLDELVRAGKRELARLAAIKRALEKKNAKKLAFKRRVDAQ